MEQIKVCRCDCVLRGRNVKVKFYSPYKWFVYENGKDVTSEFGGIIERHTPEWDAWHKEVDDGLIGQSIGGY